MVQSEQVITDQFIQLVAQGKISRKSSQYLISYQQLCIVNIGSWYFPDVFDKETER